MQSHFAQVGAMAALVAFGKVMDGNVVDIISSFAYRSPSMIPKCGTNSSDIANLYDLTDITFPYITTANMLSLYEGSMEWEEPAIWPF